MNTQRTRLVFEWLTEIPGSCSLLDEQLYILSNNEQNGLSSTGGM